MIRRTYVYLVAGVVLFAIGKQAQAQTVVSKPFAVRVTKDDIPPRITMTMPGPNSQAVFTVTDSSGLDTVWYGNKVIAVGMDTLFRWTSPQLTPQYRVAAVDIRGNRSHKTFHPDALRTPERGETEQAVVLLDQVKQADYYALLIGVEDYQHPIRDLRRPMQDVQGLYSVLTNKYTFDSANVTVLENPTRIDIERAFDQLKDKVGINDNLLVFFAGHGYWNKDTNIGFWMPTNAVRGQHYTYVRNSTIRDYFKEINSRHTLLITDACFAGSIFNSRDGGGDEVSKTFDELYRLPSRRAITSGNLQPVVDQSVFMDYLLNRLRANENSYLPSEILFNSIKIPTMHNSPRPNGKAIVPQCGYITGAGDEGGDFIFVRRSEILSDTSPPVPINKAY